MYVCRLNGYQPDGESRYLLWRNVLCITLWAAASVVCKLLCKSTSRHVRIAANVKMFVAFSAILALIGQNLVFWPISVKMAGNAMNIFVFADNSHIATCGLVKQLVGDWFCHLHQLYRCWRNSNLQLILHAPFSLLYSRKLLPRKKWTSWKMLRKGKPVFWSNA